jgi:hypothetical protein
MSYGGGTYGGYSYGVDPVYPARPHRNWTYRIRVIIFVILLPTLLLL